MILLSYDAVIFDLDDTLYEEEAYFREAFMDIAAVVSRERAISQPKVYKRILKEFHDKGSRFTRFFEHVANLFELEQSYHNRFYELYLNTDANLVLYPDAEETLIWLQNRRYRLGLITNGSVTAQRNKIKQLGLECRFDAICVSRELGEKFEKPHPRPYLAILTRLDVCAGESVYVGDDPMTDFEGANGVGMTTVRLRRGEFEDLDTTGVQVDHEITSHYELKNLLDL